MSKPPEYAFQIDIEHNEDFSQIQIQAWSDDGSPIEPQALFDALADVLMISSDRSKRSVDQMN